MPFCCDAWLRLWHNSVLPQCPLSDRYRGRKALAHIDEEAIWFTTRDGRSKSAKISFFAALCIAREAADFAPTPRPIWSGRRVWKEVASVNKHFQANSE
jgi:hypothetical protein